ncbi:hypothetical protein A3715_16395 [Oleiphilus sp. HI0009]|nr:hypothetical protein A3715_16395 [Oleiphilus sp. HI0009]
MNLILSFLFLFVLSANAHSDSLRDMVENSFENMLTSKTPASSGKSAAGRMGYFYGGSFTAKAPVVKPQLVFAIPPKKSTSGCSSIDLSFGAISFLDEEDLKNLLRAVIANGTNYAFGLAMDALCSNCFSLMQELAKKINEFSEKMKNSCEFAKAGVHSAIGAAQDYLSPEAVSSFGDNWATQAYGATVETASSAIGGFNDAMSSWETSISNSPVPLNDMWNTIGTAATENPLDRIASESDGVKQKVYYNTLYLTLKEAEIDTWFSDIVATTADERHNDILMMIALLGTKTLDTNTGNTDGDPATPDANTAVVTEIAPEITFDQIVNGDTVFVRDCQTAVDAWAQGSCLRMDETPAVPIDFSAVPARALQYLSLSRDGANDYDGAIFDDPTDISADFRTFLETDPLSVVSLYIDSRKNTNVLHDILEGKAELITKELVFQAWYSYLRAIQIAAQSHSNPIIAKDVTLRVKDARARLDKERQKLQSELKAYADAMLSKDGLWASVKDRDSIDKSQLSEIVEALNPI